MNNKIITNIIDGALQPDACIEDILINYNSEQDEINIEKIVYAICKSQKINWQKYLENNADVKDSGINPILHFLTDGMFEGRKLYIKKELELSDNTSENINVSIIIPNYNNSLLIGKCIESLQNQSMQSIEIIIVDDCSTDGSVQIIKQYMQNDARIKLIQFKSNQSQHMARKAGVNAAIGAYIMFLDPDDYFTPDACEIAFTEARKGYDVLGFNTRVIPAAGSDARRIKTIENYVNRGDPNAYQCDQIITAAYRKYIISDLLCNKIYSAALCKKCFQLMANGYFTKSEDLYEALVLLTNARSFKKINNFLYNYHIGIGITLLNDRKKIKESVISSILAKPVKLYLESCGLDEYYHKFIFHFIKTSLEILINDVHNDDIKNYFFEMSENYDILNLLNSAIDIYSNNLYKFAQKIKFINDNINIHIKNVKNIAVIIDQLNNSEVSYSLIDMLNLLQDNEYNITLFLSKWHDNNKYLHKAINIIYLTDQNIGNDYIKINLAELYNILNNSNVDLILAQTPAKSTFIWTSILLAYMRIPLLYLNYQPFYFRIMHPESKYSQDVYEEILAISSGILCFTKDCAIYFNERKLDTFYLPPFVNNHNSNQKNEPKYDIILFSDLNKQLDQLGESLSIIVKIKEARGHVNVLLISKPVDTETATKLNNLLNKMGILGNLCMRCLKFDSTNYFNNAKIYLSTNYIDGSFLSAAQALSYGLPCVVYDVPSMISFDNDSVIIVDQNDKDAAAKKIVELLNDKVLLNRLSKKAIEYSQNFSSRVFMTRFMHFMNNRVDFNEHAIPEQKYLQKILLSLVKYGKDTLPVFKL